MELGVPVTTDTVFQIQSITKQFTATGIMLLVEEGKIRLDDPISRYLDATPAAWKPITVRHLLTHTSGLKDFINDATTSSRLDATEEQIMQAVAARPLNFQPGQMWQYSNTNYHLLAMIIRKVAGKWYGDFLAERIFQPLGMTHTAVMSEGEMCPSRDGISFGKRETSDRKVRCGAILATGAAASDPPSWTWPNGMRALYRANP